MKKPSPPTAAELQRLIDWLKIEHARAVVREAPRDPEDGPGEPTADGDFGPDDIILRLTEVSRLLHSSKRWVSMHLKELPFARRVSRRNIVFSRRGLERWLETRRGA